LLLPFFAPAATIKLPAEIRGSPAEFIRVAADTDGKIVRWLVLDKGLSLFPAELLKDTRTAVVVAREPGRYRLLAVTASGDVPSEPVICTIIVGDAPTPPPPPPPASKLWAIIVVDNEAMSASVATLLADKSLWNDVEKAGHRWRVLDMRSETVKRNNYDRFVREVGGVPALVLLRSDGKHVKSIKLPSEKAGVLKALAEVTE
jgi:hypothetical protein